LATHAIAQKRPRARRGLIGSLFRGALILILVFGLIGPIVVVAIYRFVPPPMTYLM